MEEERRLTAHVAMALPGKKGQKNDMTKALQDLNEAGPATQKLRFIYGVTQRRIEPYRVNNTHKR